jgi:hypothetical protein
MVRHVALLAMAVAILVIAPVAGGYARPLHLPAPERQADDPLALIWGGRGDRVAGLDPKTLRVHSPSTPPLGSVGSWAFNRAGGDVMAIACAPTDGSPFLSPRVAVRFVDLRSLKTVPPSVRLPGFARALLWSRADRLVALVETADDGMWHAMTIDPVARLVRATTDLWGEPAGVGRSGDALVVLETPRNEIGPARLTLLNGDASVRSVQLEQVSAGTSVKTDPGGEPVITHRVPALAVDPGGERAYVVQADGPAAEVDLRTLQVAYHDLNAPRSLVSRLSSWLTPPAEAKASDGPRRDGRWLGDGLIAVTGSDDSRMVDQKGNVSYRTAPAGLAIVDTHDWTVRTLDSRADAVEVGGGVLLATAAYADGPPMGLVAYGPDRKLKFRLFPHTTVSIPAVLAGRAYVSTGFDKVSGVDRIAIVDLTSGRVVARRRIDVPTPLLSDGPD